MVLALVGTSAVRKPHQTWVLKMQRELLEPGLPLPADGSQAVGRFSGRDAILGLSSSTIAGASRRFRSAPVDLSVSVACSCPFEFLLDRTSDKHTPPRHDRLKPLTIERRQVIDARQLGKPQLEQFLASEESGRVRSFSSNPETFRQWQFNGDAGDLLFNLFFLQLADCVLLSENQLTMIIFEPMPSLLEVDNIRTLLQSLSALAQDLESQAPTR